jgi:hypothetical protein
MALAQQGRSERFAFDAYRRPGGLSRDSGFIANALATHSWGDSQFANGEPASASQV